MAAITWQNVSGTSLADSYKPLFAASHLLNSATTGLVDIFKDQNAISKANYEQSKVNNLNTIAQAALGLQKPDDAEGLAKLTSQISGFGQEIDSVAAAKLLEGRKATLQNNFVNNKNYENAVREDSDREASAEYFKLLYAGDTAGALKIRPKLQNPENEDKARYEITRQQEADRQTRASQSLSNAAQRLAIDEKRSALAGNKLATEHIAKFNASKQIWTEKADAVYKANGVTGGDLTKLDSSRLAKIQSELDSFAGKPPNAGEQLEGFIQQLSYSNMPALAQLTARDVVSKLTTTGTYITPEAQAALLKKQEDIKTKQSNAIKGNIFATKSSEEEAKDRATLLAAVRSGIKGDGEWTKGSVVDGVSKILDEGIKIDGTTYHPPARLLSSLLPGSLEEDEMFFGINETDSNLRDNLTKFYQDKNNQGAFAAAQRLTPGQLAQDLESTKPYDGSPTTLYNNVTAALAAAQKREASQSQQPLKK